jgi:hypothetical protein
LHIKGKNHKRSTKVAIVTLTLGSQLRQGLTKVRAKKEAQKSHLMLPKSVGECEGMNLHIPKKAPTLGVGVPMDSQIFREQLQGSNPLDWSVLYINRKILEQRCLKWAHMIHLDIWNTSYTQKKGRKSNWQFDSWPLKVGNWPKFLACRWRVTYIWKDLDKGYKFALNLISIRGL